MTTPRTLLCLLPALFVGCTVDARDRDVEEGPMAESEGATCKEFTDWIGDCQPNAWPGGRIPYEFHSSVMAAERTKIRDAMNRWESRTGSRIQFVPSTTDAERVLIRGDLNGCWSGMPGWDKATGTQTASWMVGCPYDHEAGHVIGLYHEHQRFDRGRYVNVNTTSLSCASYYDAVKRCSDTSKTNYGVYNDRSIMHYGCASASGCYLTLKSGAAVTPDPTFGTGPTAMDGSNVRELYAESESGWSPFRSLGRDVDSTKPLSPEIVAGVKVVGAPAITSQQDGSNNVFVRGSDGKLWHRFRVGTSWSGWYDMGGALASSPSAASLGSGSVIVVARMTNGKLGFRQYQGSTWSGWAYLNAPRAGLASAPALTAWAGGRLDVFARGGNGRLWWRSLQNYTAPNQDWAWSAWTDTGVSMLQDPAAVSWGPQRIDVVYTMTGGNIGHFWYANGATGTDSSLGCCGSTTSSPSITSRATGQLNVVMRGSDNQLWHRYWDGASWSGWAALGGILSSSPAIAAVSTTRLDVIALRTDGTLAVRSWGNY